MKKNSIISLFKKSKFIVASYENSWMMFCYIKTRIYAIKSRKILTVENKATIEKYKNIHKGERCFIVGNGPSLNVHDLNLIKDEISFTVNSAPNVYDKVDWRATYYAVFDNVSLGKIKEALDSDYQYKGIFTFNIDNNCAKNDKVVLLPTDFSCSYCLNTIWDKKFPKVFNSSKFSYDISQIIYSGATVVYTCIQIAAYMGIKEIYLLGVDCDYTNKIKHAHISMNEDEMRYSFATWKKSEVNMLSQFNRLSTSINEDIHIYNASRGGKLEAFKRVKLENIIN